MRIDKLLWYLRFAKTRSLAQALAGTGHIRLNGKRVERVSQTIAAGDVLVLPLPREVVAIKILALPFRRGPASEAQGCYRVLDERAANPIAAGNTNLPVGTSTP